MTTNDTTTAAGPRLLTRLGTTPAAKDRTAVANEIARLLLAYAAPNLLAFDLRYQAADLALAIVDKHLCRNTVPDACPAGPVCPHAPSTTVMLETVTTPPPTADEAPPLLVDDPMPRPGWLARARAWTLR
ncbi:hypothetical protein [Actinokineospora sp. UTMC 2448]|uniref:hypothetical protein n=1 Tax=Actinokineospora sp. UTMC 2448 TaxID=2268449 RepID=UPI002164000D|nr:hypothetical protein [Actinokineospora sp. UTMC 2448]UVS81824.1 hypothetical protein Actkin_05588 [Actinokineospora sp. UTMC 2448]